MLKENNIEKEKKINFNDKNTWFDEIIYEKRSDFIEYGDYLQADNFLDLFHNKGKSRLSNRTGDVSALSIPVSQPISAPPKDLSQYKGKGTSYIPFLGLLGSPESSAGKLYEWDRGVIGISYDGEIRKVNLDETSDHHAAATVRVAEELGSPILSTTQPFQAAIDCTKKGLIILQSEGDRAFVYYPNEISEEQYRELNEILLPRTDFSFSFTHNEQIYEEQTVNQVLIFAEKITSIIHVAVR
ncbi:MAG: hypothetical protein IKE70_05790 [Bacilli bacterium]|nr:hypothetical protein [Bacilli bacterium]